MIIGLTGKKQSGKTTAATVLEEQGFRRLAFADTLKEMAAVLIRHLGLDLEEYGEDKERELPFIGVSYRYLLQTLGTEWGRIYIHPDLWLFAAHARLRALRGKDIVFDDVRFDNEAEWLRNMGATIVHIHRHDAKQDNHVSEAGVRLQAGDLVIRNEGSLATFYEEVLAATAQRPLDDLIGEPDDTR